MEILGKATFTWLAAAFKSALTTLFNTLSLKNPLPRGFFKFPFYLQPRLPLKSVGFRDSLSFLAFFTIAFTSADKELVLLV